MYKLCVQKQLSRVIQYYIKSVHKARFHYDLPIRTSDFQSGGESLQLGYFYVAKKVSRSYAGASTTGGGLERNRSVAGNRDWDTRARGFYIIKAANKWLLMLHRAEKDVSRAVTRARVYSGDFCRSFFFSS